MDEWPNDEELITNLREVAPKTYFEEHPDEKIALAVDLDEVCFGYLPAFRKALAEQGIEVPEDEPASFSLVTAGWFSKVDGYFEAHSQAVIAGIYEAQEMLEGASETLWELHRAGYEINIVTSRFVVARQHELVVTQTAKALDAADIPYSNLMFLKDKTRFLADAYIDDGPHNIEPLYKLGRFTVCMETNYNGSSPGARAKDWRETREVLREHFGR